MGEEQNFERVGNAIFKALCILTGTEILKTYECCSVGVAYENQRYLGPDIVFDGG
jgi:hypothetical protein